MYLNLIFHVNWFEQLILIMQNVLAIICLLWKNELGMNYEIKLNNSFIN